MGLGTASTDRGLFLCAAAKNLILGDMFARYFMS